MLPVELSEPNFKSSSLPVQDTAGTMAVFLVTSLYFKGFHSVWVLSDGRLLLHALSCFSCDVCVKQNNYEECSNHSKVGLSRIHSMERQINHNTDQ
jgi:hypothetical protein